MESFRVPGRQHRFSLQVHCADAILDVVVSAMWAVQALRTAWHLQGKRVLKLIVQTQRSLLRTSHTRGRLGVLLTSTWRRFSGRPPTGSDGARRAPIYKRNLSPPPVLAS